MSPSAHVAGPNKHGGQSSNVPQRQTRRLGELKTFFMENFKCLFWEGKTQVTTPDGYDYKIITNYRIWLINVNSASKNQ